MTEHVNARTPELARVLKAALLNLQGGQIDHCVLRNYEELPDYTTHDVDILVVEADLRGAVETIRRTAQECEWEILAEVWQYRCHSLYLYYEQGKSIQFLTFDFVTSLPWGWLPTVNTRYVLATRLLHRGIPVARPGAEAAMRLIKVLLRNQPIAMNALELILKAISIDPEGFRATFADTLSRPIIEDLLGCLNRHETAGLNTFRSRVRWSIFWHAHSCRPLSNLLGIARYLLSRIGRYRRGSLGACIAMVGPDGAGKTALASRLADGVGSLVFRGSRIYHSHFHLLPRLSLVLRSITGVRLKQADFTRKHSGSQVKPASLLRVLLYLSYYIWDYQWGRLVLWYRKGKSQLILFDRYFYNYYHQRAYIKVPWLLLDFFRALVPKPDLVLILQADPRNIYARKPELDCAEIERQLSAIEKLGSKLDRVGITVVQTDQGLDSAENEAVRAIVARVAARNRSH